MNDKEDRFMKLCERVAFIEADLTEIKHKISKMEDKIDKVCNWQTKMNGTMEARDRMTDESREELKLMFAKISIGMTIVITIMNILIEVFFK